MRSRKGFLLLSGAILTLGSISLPVRAQTPCIPAALHGPPDRCIFDIWGYVRNLDGSPAVNAAVSDGSQTSTTDASGFYDLVELQPGSYSVIVSTRACSKVAEVNDNYAALLNGGTRQDFDMPC